MSQIAEAFVRIRPDTDDFGRELRRDVSRDLQRTERGLRGSNRELSRFSRGALVGTGALGQLGRAAAFASLSFIGGAGLVVGLRSTIGAAAEAEVAQGQLSNALEQLDISFAENIEAIEDRTTALSQMAGFDDELLTKTFTGFVRRTDDVTKALRLNAIAVDVARGRNLSLEAAAALVTRASLGMAGSLRRVGIEAEAGASATELLDLLQRKYAGSAEAYGRTAAGAQERFSVALENTQEIIGVALLPSLTKLLEKGTEWLNDSENQARIQAVVEDAAGKTARTVEFLADAYGVAAEGVRIFGDVSEVAWDVYKNLPIQRGALEAFEFFTRPPDRGWEGILEGLNEFLVASIPGRRGLDALDRTNVTRRDLVPDQVQGRGFGGTTATPAQRRAIELARTSGTGTNAEIAAINAELVADQRALDFALRAMQTQGKNQKRFADEAERLTAEITSAEERLGQIAEGRAIAAEDAREKVRQAGINASLFVIELLNQARDTSIEEAARLAVERENRLERLTRVPTALALRTQLAEARAEEEEDVIPFLRREAQALERQIAELKRRDASLVQILTAKVNLATIRRRIREIDREERDQFTAQDFFSLAAGEFAALGSNVGSIDVALSPQEAGGAAVRAARSVSVNQHFYGQQPNPAQALQQASQAARALR